MALARALGRLVVIVEPDEPALDWLEQHALGVVIRQVAPGVYTVSPRATPGSEIVHAARRADRA